MLEESILRYQNRSIEAAQVITNLIELAKQMRAAQRRGEDLGLSDEELAFYDALEANDSAAGCSETRIFASSPVNSSRQYAGM